MKINPEHNYKKPLYAIGIAAAIGATAILGTACGGSDANNRGHSAKKNTASYSKIDADATEVDIMGEVAYSEG